MAALTLRLLGPPVVRAADNDLRLPSVKAQALLYYLAAQPAHPFSRSHLCALLWEDSGEADGRNSLSTVLTRLRQALPVFPVAAEADTLTWRPGDAAWVDSDAFLAHGATLADLRAAADLWRGPFLDGFGVRDSSGYDEWLTATRQMWEGQYLGLLAHLANAAATAADWDLAQATAARALAVDPLQERFHRVRMTALYQAGDRAAALVQYETCARLLQRDLGAAPDAETTALFEAIRDGRLHRATRRPTPRPAAPPRAARPPAGPILERHRELAVLQTHLAQTAARQTGSSGRPAGQLVVIEGEAGIGKSRLLEEVTWRASQDEAGWTVLSGHCYEAERALPYHPLVDALRPLVASLDWQTLPLADVWLAEVARLLPELIDLRPDLATPARLDATQEQRRLFEGLASFLAALPAPILFLLDDLQWADAGTLHLLAYLVRHLADAPILFVAAVRADDEDDALTNLLWRLEREGRLARVTLGPLSPMGTSALVKALLNTEPGALGHRLHEETEGNPLFTVEIARSLAEAGALATPGALRGPLVLPPSVVAVIQGRLARLRPPAREFLAAASVFRRDFSFDTVRQVSGQAEDEALDALDELLRLHLLVEGGRKTRRPVWGDTEDDLRYAFSHDKVRAVVHDGLSQARRTALHRRAVDALGPPAAARAAERVAYHARLGRRWDVALTWSVQAAEGATAVFDYTTAVLLYQQALEAASHLPADEDRRRQDIILRLQLARVAFYIQPGRLMEWLGPAERDAVALGDEELLAFVWLAQGGGLYITGRLEEARVRLERLLPLVERTGAALQMARTVNILGRVLAMQGDYARGLPLLSEAADRLDMVGSHNDALISRGMVAAERAFLGEFDSALAAAVAVYAASLQQADLAAVAAAAVFIQAVHHAWGRWADAEAWGRRALDLAQQTANLVYERNVYLFLGLPLAYQGDVTGGRAMLERAIAVGGECASAVFMGRAHAWLAEVHLLAGDALAAQDAAKRGRALAADAGARLDHALARRVLGQALTALGDLAAAETELAAALAEGRAIGAQPEVGRTLAALGRLALARGDADHVRAWRDQAADVFARLGLAWDAARLPLP